MQFRLLDSLFFRSTVKLLAEILSEKVLQFDVRSFPPCGPPADRWDVVVSKKEKKDLHPKFGDLKWKPGALDGYVVSRQITKRSSTIIRGYQMKSWALRRSSGSLTTLLWDLYDGHTAMGPGQIAPCNPQPWVGGPVVCLWHP